MPKRSVNYSMDAGNFTRTGEFSREKKNGWEYYHFPELTARGIIHGFFTRDCPSLLDDEENRVFLDIFSLERSVILHQEHGNTIHAVGPNDRPEKGDGILLYKPGIAGVIKTADCMGIVLVDPAFPMTAIIHAGWRGTLQRITSDAVAAMSERGAAPQRIIALLGPSIRGCCYTVGAEVKESFLKEGFPDIIFHVKDGSTYLDLKDANTWLLKGAGVDTILDTGLCTFCSEDPAFASYRRGAGNKRQINFVAIK
jgi:polyphenol oxidase